MVRRTEHPPAAPPGARASTFPPRYRLHKYWGKKPGNVVAAYLARFAEPGAPVLDFFAGSGVVLAETLISRRPGVAIDLNPIAGLITRVAVEGASVADLRAEAARLRDLLAPLRAALFAEPCARCDAPGEIVSTAFEGERPFRVTLACPRCGTVSQAPSTRARPALPDPGPFPDAPIYPGWQMRKLVRLGLTRFHQLFTARNLVAVAHLRRALDTVADPKTRRALLVSFTASLAQATKMMADYRGRAGGPSWKLNSYWLPATSQELNPFHYLDNRVAKTAAGLLDMQSALARPVSEGRDYRIFTLSAERLGERVAPASVGYIFTDPPYGGEGIQYGELSMLWNLWAGEEMGMEAEVAVNPRQKKDPAAFARRLGECMAAGHEALVPGGFASVTFASKDARTWEILRAACARAGFVLEGSRDLVPSAPNLTNILSEAAPKEDVILTFRKPPNPVRVGRSQ